MLDETFRGCCNALKGSLLESKASTSYLSSPAEETEAKMLYNEVQSFVSKSLSRLLGLLSTARWLIIMAKQTWPEKRNEDAAERQVSVQFRTLMCLNPNVKES